MLSVENPPPPPSPPPPPPPPPPHSDPRYSFSSSSLSSPSCLKTTSSPPATTAYGLHDALDHDHNGFGSHSQTTASSLHDNLTSTNFSIRDYVFAARKKHISKSWPFSPKNLQLCLNNGVKDPLPPFLCSGSSRSSCLLGRCSAEPADEQAVDTGEAHLVPKDHLVASGSWVDPGFRRLLGAGHPDLSPIPTEQERHLESEEASSSKKLSSAVSDGIETAASAFGAMQAPKKKKKKNCRLVVKLDSNSYNKSSTEDITSTPEGMIFSKTCPVCQTFSSSSNTTLNAHIDQCLSAKSPSNWSRNLERPKPRIKPRKMRLMYDVYATAQRCTLEDLDRRNGTQWAVEKNLHSPATISARDQGQNQTSSSTRPLDHSNNGAVYVDSSGTKIRILSMSNDISPGFQAGVHAKVKKPQNICGSNGIHASKKKKKRLGNHVKYLKLTPHISPPLESRSPEQDMGLTEANVGEGQTTPLFKNRKRKSCNNSEVLGKWESSRSIGLPKSKSKSKSKSNQHSNGMARAKINALAGSKQSLFNGSCVARTHVLGHSISQGISVPAEIRSAGPSHEAEIANERYSMGRKRQSNPMLRVTNHDNAELLMELSYPGYGNLSGGNDSLHEGAVGVPLRFRETENWFCSTNRTSSGNFHGRSSRELRLPSSSKSSCLLSQETVPVCQFSAKQKDSALKKCPPNLMGNEYAEWPMFQRSDLVQCNMESHNKASEMARSSGGKRLLKIRSRRGLTNSHQDGDLTVTKVPETALHSHRQDEEVGNFGYSDRANHDLQGHFSCIMETPNKGEMIATDLSSKAAENMSHFSDTEFHMLAKASDEANQGCLLCSEGSISLMELNSCDKHGMLSAEDIGVVMVEHETTVANMKVGGEDSIAVVDPIPIPGPPGSYLPSPRRMESEVLQGNSSITTSCMQFSHDQSDVADVDSSDSPVSALSSISNFLEPKSALIYPGPYRGPHSPRMNGPSGFSIVSERHAVTPQLASVAGVAGVILDANSSHLCVNSSQGGTVSQQRGAPRWQSSDQPCCCSRKEGIPWDAALNFQELQFPKRHSGDTVPLALVRKKFADSSFETAADDLNDRAETATPIDCFTAGRERPVHSASMRPGDPSPVPIAACASHSMSPTLVLRLMGKNLMVANKNEGSQLAFEQPTLESRNSTIAAGASWGCHDNPFIVPWRGIGSSLE